MFYHPALGTGFLAEEVSPLTPERFDLDADPPTVIVSAGYARNSREAVQPIAGGLADRLRTWLARRPAGTPVFVGMTEKTAKMLRVDPKTAGVPYKTALLGGRLPCPASILRLESGGVGSVGQKPVRFSPGIRPRP